MNDRESSLFRLLFILSLAIGVAGCARNDMGDLKQYVKEVKARKAGHIEPLPEIKQIETFAYVAADRRSPFRPVQQGEEQIPEAAEYGIAPDPNRRKEELENYSLDSLRMVGTLELTEIMWGLIKTRDKTIHRVKAGNYMGKNHGQITGISEGKIELTEIIPDGQRGYRERQASLALKE